MGITAARPYIIDDFESEDDTSFEPALEYMTDSLLLNAGESFSAAVNEKNGHISTEQQQTQGSAVDRKTSGVHASSSNIANNLQGLEELLKLLENHDFDGAQKAASLLKKSTAFCHFDSSEQEDVLIASVTQSVKSTGSSTVTSTWSTNTEEDLTEVTSSSNLLHTKPVEDLTEDQRNALILLDEELSQFEANEEKIASDPHVFHSGIPRLISSRSSSGSTGTLTDRGRQTPDRKRSPSPSGRLKTSGIPRYSWAHVSPVTGSPSSPGESKLDQRLDANSLSDTLESLPELTDRLQANRRIWDKTFVIDKTGTSTGRSENSLTSGQSGDSQALDINISDHTGRARVKKRHFCLPPSWTKPEEFQKIPSKSRSNTMHSNSSCTQMYSNSSCTQMYSNSSCTQMYSNSSCTQVATAEILDCKGIGECGDPSERKVLDLKRWYCISRPQYRSSCGVSAIVSCWNYLFSTVGHGRLKPVTQEAAMKMFGFTSPFDEISFGPITGNVTLLRWFSELCSHFNVNGQGFILYKPSGTNQTDGMTDEMALDFLKKGLKDTTTAFIYHCHNHYFCPIGYEDTPQFCVDAYGGDVGNSSECWVLIGDTSRKYPSVHCVSWDQICQDLNCKSPSFINIRQIWKGVQQQKSLKTCGCSENLHCILAFQTVSDDTQSSSNSQSSSSNASSVTKSPHPQPNSLPKLEVPTANVHSKANAHRPELGDGFKTGYQEEEVGVVKLGSYTSDDKHVDEREISVNGVDSSVKECEISVNGGEISVNGDEISVNGSEISINGSDISFNRGENSVNRGEIAVSISEISVNESEISVNWGDMSVIRDGISVNGGEISVNGGEISVMKVESSLEEGDSSINGDKRVKEDESSVNESESSVNEIICSVKEDESSVKEVDSSVKVDESSVKDDESSVMENESSVKGDESSVKENESSLNTDESSAMEGAVRGKEDESSVEEGESSVSEAESSVKEGDKSVEENESSVKEIESSVQDSESYVEGYDSSVNGGEKSEEENESSVREIESSVQDSESYVEGYDSSVNGGEKSEEENESSVREDESSVKEDESSVKEDESSVKEDESSVKEDESSVKEDESSVKEDESSVKEDESSVKEDESSVKEDESAVKEDESSVKEDESSVKEDESSVKEVESSVKEDESSVKEDESSVKEDESSVKEDESSVKEDESSGEESESSVKEVEISVKEVECSVRDEESSDKEDENSVNESEISVKDGERTVIDEERVEGGNSSVQEGETLQYDQVS